MNEIRIDIKIEEEFERLTAFLTFQKFPFKIGEKKTFDAKKLLETKEQFILIKNDKIEEFKVVYSFFKNLKVDSGIIKHKPMTEKRLMIDDRALHLKKEELLEGVEDFEGEQKEKNLFQFAKEEEKENQSKPLEEVFYDEKNNEKKKENEQKIAKKDNRFGLKVSFLLIWIIIVVILVLEFVLIR